MDEDVKRQKNMASGKKQKNPGKSITFSITAQSKEFTASYFFCITEAWFSIFYFSLQATKVSWTVFSSFKYYHSGSATVDC